MSTASSKLRDKLKSLHARMGDFWWYSLMLFLACRAADFLNAFVGLWLVPKYVVSIVTSVFALRKELSVPAEPYWSREVARRFGRLFLSDARLSDRVALRHRPRLFHDS